MRFSPFTRALLRGMLAGAVVLTGTACSRPDKAESGSNNSSTVLPDSNAMQPSDTGAAAGSVNDTTATPKESSTQPSTPAQPNATAEASPPASSDSSVSGIPSPDTSLTATAEAADTESIEVAGATDTAVGTDTVAVADTAAAGYVEMARDTTTVADQADSASTPSTEILGSVTTDDETADEQIINPDDQETVAASDARTDEVGAAAVAGGVTGADAVALLSRAGVRCAVVDPETNEAVRWDMSSTPVTLNPCGMGSMVLSRIWTER